MWNFQNLPKDKYNEAIEAVENYNFKKLLLLHNKYKLSPYSYCCGSDNILYRFFKNAIEKNIIWKIKNTNEE